MNHIPVQSTADQSFCELGYFNAEKNDRGFVEAAETPLVMRAVLVLSNHGGNVNNRLNLLNRLL